MPGTETELIGQRELSRMLSGRLRTEGLSTKDFGYLLQLYLRVNPSVMKPRMGRPRGSRNKVSGQEKVNQLVRELEKGNKDGQFNSEREVEARGQTPGETGASE